MRPPAHLTEAVKERAAIIEFDGGASRSDAVINAWEFTACVSCMHYVSGRCEHGQTVHDCTKLGADAATFVAELLAD